MPPPRAAAPMRRRAAGPASPLAPAAASRSLGRRLPPMPRAAPRRDVAGRCMRGAALVLLVAASLHRARRRRHAARWPRCCPSAARRSPSAACWCCSRCSSPGSRPASGPALMGAWRALRPRPSPLMRGLADARRCARSTRDARTAIVMPICNEDVATRVRRPARDLRVAGRAPARSSDFDFFVLSATRSDPDIARRRAGRVARARRALARRADGEPRPHLLPLAPAPHQAQGRQRRRLLPPLGPQLPLHGRARRRQRDDRRMPDDAGAADGSATRAPASSRPRRAPPAARRCMRASSSSRARVYGPLFTAGMHFWQLGESHYWGHNAIIRVAPFMRHCALGARCPGSGALSGEILSHDFVEAALMRRAGWKVWIAYDLRRQLRADAAEPARRAAARPPLVPGQPAELAPDVRAAACTPVHRAVFVTGVLAYVSAPLWLGLPAAVDAASSRCTRCATRPISSSRTSCFRSGRPRNLQADAHAVRPHRRAAAGAEGAVDPGRSSCAARPIASAARRGCCASAFIEFCTRCCWRRCGCCSTPSSCSPR